MIDLDTLNIYVEKGLVSKQSHPLEELYIYNYTPRASYERVWDEVTLNCRGLILDGEGNIVARPFPKFFNLDEHSRSDITFSKPFKIYEKMDGSLGIFYKLPSSDKWAVSTRGSFTSNQAIEATRIYNDKYAKDWTPAVGTTPLVEIIYPSNRIVVDYGDMEDLVLLTVIDNATGRDIPEAFWYGPRAGHFSVGEGFEGLKPREVAEHFALPDDGDHEGFVLVFDWPKTGPKTRVKVKLDEYKRLHRILTGVSTKTIWATLKEGRSMDEVLERVPDEFYNWVRDTSKELLVAYKNEGSKINERFEITINSFKPESMDYKEGYQYARRNRKAFAELIKGHTDSSLMFALLDEKDITEKIWDRVKPAYVKAFTNDIDG